MSTNAQNGYMLLFRGNDWCTGLSPEEMQQISGQWMSWFKRLTDAGKALAGSPLEPQGKVISGKGGRVVSDGPFAESKETIGGYFLLNVGSMEEAVTIAKQCPGLAYGAVVEVRPVAAACPLSEEARAQAHPAMAHA